MSIIFGIREAKGRIANRQELLALARATERFAPDGTFIDAEGMIGVGFQPFHTTKRSRLPHPVCLDSYGNALAFDGRLDNFQTILDKLDIGPEEISDPAVILAAFLRWGPNIFPKLVGEWAFALWSGKDHILYLARDHAGTRTLFFNDTGGRVLWGTHLETFFSEGSALRVDEEYAARFLCSQPIRDLTPYGEVRAVPAGYCLAIKENNDRTTIRLWNCMAAETLKYGSDREYEEHFLSLFGQAVKRRTVPGDPIAAELSGGMDSTSIVCMSDYLRTSLGSDAERLDTISYFDDSEPNWNERPYFSLVETKRGKVGTHIEVNRNARTFEVPDSRQGIYLVPGADSGSIMQEQQFCDLLATQSTRAILSGIGGDELLGGVPTPIPELADHLVSGRLFSLLRQGTAWCVERRSPLIHMLASTAIFTAQIYRSSQTVDIPPPPWISNQLARRSRGKSGSGNGMRLLHRPSAISNACAWSSILETLPHLFPRALTRFEYRYPYLDRDLVDFLHRVPREQLVRPGRRRSLMRRALLGIVPTDVLERRRKAFVARGPIVTLHESERKIASLFKDSAAADYGYVDSKLLLSSVASTLKSGDPKWIHAILRTVAFELWLRANDGNVALPEPPRYRESRMMRRPASQPKHIQN